MPEFLGNRDGVKAKTSPPFWPAKNGDIIRTGSSIYTAPSNLAAGPSWTFQEPDHGVVRATPLIDENRSIYFSTLLGRVYKFDAHGNMLWRFQAPNDPVDTNFQPCVPVIYGDMIFSALANGTVFALDIATGSLRWSKQIAKTIGGDTWSMSAGEGLLIVPCNLVDNSNGNSHIMAMSLKDGTRLWTYEPSAVVYNLMLSIINSTVVFEDSIGNLYRLGLLDGTELWKVAAPAGADFTTGGAMLGPDGVIYASSNVKILGDNAVFGVIAAHNLEDGSLIWRTQLDLPANSGPAVGHLASPQGPLGVVIGIGVNPPLQLPPVAEWLLSGVVLPNRAVALDAKTGKALWEFKFPDWHGAAAGDTMIPSHICLPDAFANAAIGGDGTAYVMGESGVAYAISDKDGDGQISESAGEVSSFDTKNSFQASPAIAPGMLAIAPCNSLVVFLSDTIA